MAARNTISRRRVFARALARFDRGLARRERVLARRGRARRAVARTLGVRRVRGAIGPPAMQRANARQLEVCTPRLDPRQPSTPRVDLSAIAQNLPPVGPSRQGVSGSVGFRNRLRYKRASLYLFCTWTCVIERMWRIERLDVPKKTRKLRDPSGPNPSHRAGASERDSAAGARLADRQRRESDATHSAAPAGRRIFKVL